MRSVLVCVVTVALTLSCREQRHWAGARIVDRGAHLELAAKYSLCGCVTLENKTADLVFIQSAVHDAVTGRTILPPHGRLTQRFDWAGANNDNIYEISVSDKRGRAINFADTLAMAHWGWTDCAATSCNVPPLKMDVGLTGRTPGER